MEAFQNEEGITVCCRNPSGFHQFVSVRTPMDQWYPELDQWMGGIGVMPPRVTLIQVTKYGIYKMYIGTNSLMEVVNEFPE